MTTRQSNGFALLPITRTEVEAWERREGICLDPWEARAIHRLDAEQRAAFAPKGKGGKSDAAEAVEES